MSDPGVSDPGVSFKVQDHIKPKALTGISDDQIGQHWRLYEGYVKSANGLLDGAAKAEPGSPTWAEIKRRLGFEVDGMVEKPPKGTAPSNLSITGRYILQPEIFKILETQERGAGGEVGEVVLVEHHAVHLEAQAALDLRPGR